MGSAAPQSSKSLPYAGFRWDAAFPLVAPQLPLALVGADDCEHLSQFARDLPGFWHWGMLETRLGVETAPVDLLAAMAQTPETRQQITDIFEAGGHQALDPVSGPMAQWAENSGSLFSDSPNIWLEWDRDGTNKPPLPWLCLAPDFFSPSQRPLAPEQLGELASQFMRSSPELEVAGAADCLIKLAQALPQGGKLMGFSSLKPRGKSTCRVFARLPRGSTLDYLNAIEWPGRRDELPQLLPLFSLDGEEEWCQLEFDSEVGPYLALELGQTERGFRRRETRERWLDAAVGHGWSTRDKAKAVLNWHGQSHCSLPGEGRLRLLRSFHLKLVLAEEQPALAKAYLGFYFRRGRQALAA